MLPVALMPIPIGRPADTLQLAAVGLTPAPPPDEQPRQLQLAALQLAASGSAAVLQLAALQLAAS